MNYLDFFFSEALLALKMFTSPYQNVRLILSAMGYNVDENLGRVLFFNCCRFRMSHHILKKAFLIL